MVSAELSASEEEEMRVSMVRSYGNSARAVERRYGLFMHIAVLMLALMTVANPVWAPAWAEAAKPVKLVVLGDSLSAGLGLPAQEAFPSKLQKALQDKGIEVDMTNAGVSGDTSSGGRDRLDWSVPDGTDGVIIELGANDALRGIDPDLTRAALTEIVQRLKARKIAVMLCGMLAPPNYGADYAARFNSIYSDLAKTFDVPLYPFFLDGVAADAKLNQADGIHPTAAGVDIIVRNILPTVEAFLGTIAEQRR
jgi:acyl-CoA thioesterase-1